MLTVGDRLKDFQFTGVRPGAISPDDAFVAVNDASFSEGQFKGKWKVLVFYPKDFTFVCPTEIVAMMLSMQNLPNAMLCCSSAAPTTNSASWPGNRPTRTWPKPRRGCLLTPCVTVSPWANMAGAKA